MLQHPPTLLEELADLRNKEVTGQERGRRGKGGRKRLPSSLIDSGRTGLFNCLLIREN